MIVVGPGRGSRRDQRRGGSLRGGEQRVISTLLADDTTGDVPEPACEIARPDHRRSDTDQPASDVEGVGHKPSEDTGHDGIDDEDERSAAGEHLDEVRYVLVQEGRRA